MRATQQTESLAVGPHPSTKRGPLWSGTAGFSYPDWVGPVYGGSATRGEHPLTRLSRWVDLLEANVSYYRIPAPAIAASWLLKTLERKDFRFTAKLWRGFTHGPERATRSDLRAMRDFLAALGEDGRLLGALAQFPPSFRLGDRERAYVLRLADHFDPTPLCVEFRDSSWDSDAVRADLDSRGIGWVVADLPPGGRAIPPGPHVTGGFAYVRFHGRSPAWGESGAGRDRKYDWLYDVEDLRPWLTRIERMREASSRTVVVFNNHFSGKAVANALEWKSLSTEERVEVPPSLLAAFPRLARVARPEPLGAPPPGLDGPPLG